ncbi:MAG TPA: formylmethanofuran dehydrogenase subunit B [Methylophilaceae bacterium]|nr:formylmethanofuran dehydrogenase subunit B [Methylophilaceae bacterium]
MVNPAHPAMQAVDHETALVETVTCPGCGLLCDDISIARNGNALEVTNTSCPKSIAFFRQASTNTAVPLVAGQPATLQSAVRRAAKLLTSAAQPLIAGLATDVYGMRAVLELADRTGATLDHMNSEAAMRNVYAVQNAGWHTCTLTEVRNRADLVLIVGGDIVNRFPRFFERIVWNRESMFDQDTAARDVVYLGGPQLDTAFGISPRNINPTVISCDNRDLPQVMAALLALANGRDLRTDSVAGIPLADLQHLATRLAAAKYSVIAWAAADFDFPHAELTVQQIAELISHLNHTTRCSGLPLSGNDGDITAIQVSSWISGYPMRNSYKRSYPEYDPYRFSTSEQLNTQEADALVWISTLDPTRTPPATTLQTVVIGHPAMQFEHQPEVFIPVGIPGVDHAGIMFRSDSVVSLPLGKLRKNTLPSLRGVLDGIRAELGAPTC